MIQIPICRIAAVLYTSLRHFDRGRFSMLRINQNGNWERILGRWQAIFSQESWRISKKNCTVQRAKGPPVGYVDIFPTSPGNGMKWCQIINNCLASQDQAPACVARVEGLGGGRLFRVRFHQQRISSAKRSRSA